MHADGVASASVLNPDVPAVPELAAGAGNVPGFKLYSGQGEPVLAATAREWQSFTGHKIPGAERDEGGVSRKAAASG